MSKDDTKLNDELVGIYKRWLKALRELKNDDGIDFFSKKYSNPYFTCIPDNWTDTDAIKILIVGQEAAGDWGRAKWEDGDKQITFDDENNDESNIRKMQDFCWKTLLTNVQYLKDNYTWFNEENKGKWKKKNGSAFWRRVNSVINGICEKYKENPNVKILCGWTELDLVYHQGKGKDCRLTKDERLSLHQHNCLTEVIKKLQPQIVLYCGWLKHEISIQKEFGDEMLNELQTEWSKDRNEKIVEIKCPSNNNIIHHIFTYHPSFTKRPYCIVNYPKYEDKLIDRIKDIVNLQ